LFDVLFSVHIALTKTCV